MKYFAMTLNLKDDPELIERYKEYHRNVWPENLAMMRDSGITRMKIFLRGRRMFMYCDTRDDYDPKKVTRTPEQVQKSKAWEELMHQFQEPLPDSPPGKWWVPMEEVFDLEKA